MTLAEQPRNPKSLPPHLTAPFPGAFVTRGELQYAMLWDSLGLRWEYEPHMFPLAFREDGSLAAAFKPDFWLPELDLYVEVTSGRKSLRGDKRRKVRESERLHGIRVLLLGPPRPR